MNFNLHRIFSCFLLSVNKTPEAKINHLPNNTLKIIFSCLSNQDLESTAEVSRHWRDLTLSTTCFSMRLFIQFLLDNLPSLPLTHKTMLLDLMEDQIFFRQPTLRRSQESFLNDREPILALLKTLDPSQLELLKQASKGLSMPPFFESIFDLTKVYQELAQAHLMSVGHPQAIAFRECVQKLAALGELKKANYATNFIRYVGERTIAFNSIRAKRYELALKRAALTKPKVHRAYV